MGGVISNNYCACRSKKSPAFRVFRTFRRDAATNGTGRISSVFFLELLAKRVKCHGGFDLLTGLPSRKAEISNTGFCFPILDMTYNSIQNSQKQILVAGDAMLDEYWSGDADRISPEAPVPVVAVAKTEKRPGGAANMGLPKTSLAWIRLPAFFFPHLLIYNKKTIIWGG